MTDDELKRLLDGYSAENRRHFDETAGRISAESREFFEIRIEDIRHEIQLVAEGVRATRETLARKFAEVRGLEGSTH
jgi:hypothetical protein